MSDLFDSPKEKDDFLIALVVIAFFFWLFFFSGFLGKKSTINELFVEEPNKEIGEPSITLDDDIDKDGIKNEIDLCPERSGPMTNNGCPVGYITQPNTYNKSKEPKKQPLLAPITSISKNDRDNDGIVDKNDRCPSEKGVKENDGCPMFDKDNDGIADNKDDCPETKGAREFYGCPDTDGDGIIDKEDNCPTKKGIIKTKGCPELLLKDEEKALLYEEVKTIQFEYSNANLTIESKNILKKIASLLTKYPNTSLIITGHTDNGSTSERNLRLSEYRAKSCKAYLVGLGITENRIKAEWYGETQPIMPNDTAEGRQQNMRVEFNLEQNF